jgi:hypothetical protein
MIATVTVDGVHSGTITVATTIVDHIMRIDGGMILVRAANGISLAFTRSAMWIGAWTVIDRTTFAPTHGCHSAAPIANAAAHFETVTNVFTW